MQLHVRIRQKLGIITFVIVVNNEQVRIWEAVSFLLFYIIYIIVVVVIGYIRVSSSN